MYYLLGSTDIAVILLLILYKKKIILCNLFFFAVDAETIIEKINKKILIRRGVVSTSKLNRVKLYYSIPLKEKHLSYYLCFQKNK